MLNNFIYAKKKSLFETALNNSEVLDEAIVFIEDTKEIWNHGSYYGNNGKRDILPVSLDGAGIINFDVTTPMLSNTIYVSDSPVNGISISEIIQPKETFSEYTLHFVTSDTISPITFPEYILWANGNIPEIETNTSYELSIVATKFGDSYQFKAILVSFRTVE